jgi:hypothetical protein
MFLKVNHRESYYMNIYNEKFKNYQIYKENNKNKCIEDKLNNNKLSDNTNPNHNSNKNINSDRTNNNIGKNQLALPLAQKRENTVKEKKKLRRLLSQPDVIIPKKPILNNDEIEKQIKTNHSNFNLNFDETFKTSLYNTNSLSRDNSNYSISSENFRKIKKNNDINKNLKKMFIDPEYLDQLTSHISPRKIIKVKDYENFKNFRIEDSFDKELLQLFNINKEMMKKLKKLKIEAEALIRNELDRVGKCFYLEDYEAKFNTNLKTVIGALIGEDNIRNELLKQEKEQKDYFKTIKSIRNFNGFFYKKCT